LLEKKSSYTFLYNDQVIPEGKVNIDVKEMSIPQILNDAFKNTNLSFRVLPQKLIVVTTEATSRQADITVSGTVRDAKGETLPGATISIQSGKGIAVTDVNGNFR